MKTSRWLPFLFLASLVSAGPVVAQCTGALGNISTSPESMDFGTVTIGTTRTLSFAILNNGGSFLEVYSIDSLNGRFTVSGFSLPLCIDPYSSKKINVTFQPADTPTIESRIRIESSDYYNSPVFVDVRGNGKVGAKITVSPTSLDFGQVAVGSQAQKIFVIRNTGGSSIVLKKVVGSKTEFAILSPSFPRTLAVGSSQSVQGQFAPRQAGNYTGRFDIYDSNDKVVGSVAVYGQGTLGGARIRVSTNRIDFGTMDVGTWVRRKFTISNDGGQDLQVSFSNVNGLMIKPAGPLAVSSHRSVPVELRWVAPKIGSTQVTLNIRSNDSSKPKTAIRLLCSGRPGKLGFVNRKNTRIGTNTTPTTGMQWVDYNRDGRLDLYLTGEGGNQLFRNLGNGQFSNVSDASRLKNNGKRCTGASWADVDNDGDPDVFMANPDGTSTICRNNKGVFSCSTSAMGMFSKDNGTDAVAGVWLDFNRDGLLDLYLVNDHRPNRLLRNQGAFRWVDVAEQAHVAWSEAGRGAVAADFDNDGFQDLFVINYGSPNKMFANNGNQTFRDVTSSAHIGFTGQSMQAAVSDYDGDGDLDIFVVNDTGPCILYRNVGHFKFQNATAAAGLAKPRDARSASFSDYDSDGDEDLILATASGTSLYRNNGAGRFTRVPNVDLSNSSDPSATASGDYNGDGVPDVAIGDSGAAPNSDSVYQNTGGAENNWVALVLRGTRSNSQGIGAKVILRAGAVILAKAVTAGNGQNQESATLEFGLGGATLVDSIVVSWPSGTIQTVTGVAVNQQVTIVEP